MKNITKEFLISCLDNKMTNQQIADLIGCSKSNVGYYIAKFELNNMQEKAKRPTYKFEKIDSKEKAYILGFICCDGAIQNEIVEITVEKNDKEILDFISCVINCNVWIDDTFDKKAKRFPRARLSKKIPDIKTFVGGAKKPERHLPIANNMLMRYVILGAFDADGCITWGYRKDKNRLWHKVSFTTAYKIAIAIQKFLMNELQISTIVRPKSDGDCYVIEFANKTSIIKFLDYIYQDDFIVLKRKYLKANALRLKLEENGEGA